MSNEFFKENICNGISPDSYEELLKEEVFVVEENKNIIGFAYGHFEICDTNKTYYKKGDKSFYIEVMYILKSFRNKGYGNLLHKHIEQFAKENGCSNIQVDAVSKNYKSLLKFYIEELDYNFWSAWLIKPL